MNHPDPSQIYPRSGDCQTVYLKNVVSGEGISIGDYTIYHDFQKDPRDFQTNNILYRYPVNHDKLQIGRFCSVACGAKFLFNGGNHTLHSFSTYPFAIFGEEWDETMRPAEAWDNRGDIVIGSDVWIGYEAVVRAGVHIGDGAIIGTRALVTRDVPPYAIVGGVPARPVKLRFPQETVEELLKLRWWDWPEETIRRHLAAIRIGNLEELREAANIGRKNQA